MMVCFRTGLAMDLCPCSDCRFHRQYALMGRMAGPSVAAAKKPMPKEHTDRVVTDLEIGRYALRTFQCTSDVVGGQRLKSLFQEFYWDGGVAIADCRKPGDDKCEASPGPGCACGIYGTVSLEALRNQYAAQANVSVAVIAAEGETVIGSKGLRTAAARIVAYWCHPDIEESVAPFWSDPRTFGWEIAWDRPIAKFINPARAAYAKHCPDAKVFADLHEMVKAYKIPIQDPDRKEPDEYWQATFGAALRTASAIAISSPPQPLPAAAFPLMSDSQNEANVKKLTALGAITKGGADAIKHALGFLKK